MDHYLPALLMPGLYHVDGQQRDEVLHWGAWLQSRMHRRGVTCSDCHEPHSQKLRVEGNALCGSCHAPGKFDTPAHHHHATGSAGAQCVDCHMPRTTYMVVDGRRDHSMRVPRPDESAAFGVPNACNSCHRDARRSGRRPQYAAGSAATRKASNDSPRRSTRPRPGRPAPPPRWLRSQTTSASHRSCAPRHSSVLQPLEHRMPASPRGQHAMPSRCCGWRQFVWPSRCRRRAGARAGAAAFGSATRGAHRSRSRDGRSRTRSPPSSAPPGSALRTSTGRRSATPPIGPKRGSHSASSVAAAAARRGPGRHSRRRSRSILHSCRRISMPPMTCAPRSATPRHASC